MHSFLLILNFLVFGLFTDTKSVTPNCHHYTFTNMEKQKVPLGTFKGKKILIVNIASHCGYTPQLEALEKLYQTYKNKLVVIGFPANDFKNQAPEENQALNEFCKKNYGVSFPLSEKIAVLGDKKDSLYTWLTEKKLNGVSDATITWNFNKFLIDENGKLIEKFDSKVLPLDEKITRYLR